MKRSTSDSNPFRSVLDVVPIATYCTNAAGVLTYFNPAAIEFSGRSPKVGVDQWCVTWKLFHTDGAPMPHDQCPMAVALKEGRKVWGMEAIAERPDGTRRPFTPYPTPIRDPEGNLIGGINVLLDLADRKTEYVAALLSFIVASDEMHSAIKDLSQPDNGPSAGVMPVTSCVACGGPITDDGNARIAFHVDCYQKSRRLAPSESDAWEAFARLRDAGHLVPPSARKIRKQKSKYI